jgi:hypothetical protein
MQATYSQPGGGVFFIGMFKICINMYSGGKEHTS